MYRLKALLRYGHDSFLNVPLNAAQHTSNDSGINVNSTKADTGSDIHVEGVGQLGNADNTTNNIRVVHVVIEGTDDEHNEKLMNRLEKLMKSDDGVYLFKFSSKSGMEQVLERGPLMIHVAPKALSMEANKPSLMEDQKEGFVEVKNQKKKGKRPTIDKASIMDKFVLTKNSFDALMDSNNSFRANKANKQTSSEWSEDIESDDEVDEVLYPEGNKFEDQFDIRLKSRVRK
nr:hypothetical protein [Tanacetum cinerariifolium]